jgi:hypothetical protein
MAATTKYYLHSIFLERVTCRKVPTASTAGADLLPLCLTCRGKEFLNDFEPYPSFITYSDHKLMIQSLLRERINEIASEHEILFTRNTLHTAVIMTRLAQSKWRAKKFQTLGSRRYFRDEVANCSQYARIEVSDIIAKRTRQWDNMLCLPASNNRRAGVRS